MYHPSCLLLLACVLAACDTDPKVITVSSACAPSYEPNETRTRVAAEFYLGRPVLCGRGSTNGTTCLDTQGGVVWCPLDTAQLCVVRTPSTTAVTVPTPPAHVERPLQE